MIEKASVTNANHALMYKFISTPIRVVTRKMQLAKFSTSSFTIGPAVKCINNYLKHERLYGVTNRSPTVSALKISRDFKIC